MIKPLRTVPPSLALALLGPRLPSIDALAERCVADIDRLDVGVRRLVNPHRYHVSVTDRLHELRRELIARATA